MYPRILAIAALCLLATGCATNPEPPQVSTPVINDYTGVSTDTLPLAQPVEPQPAAQVEVPPPPPADLWERLREGMGLTHETDRRRVQAEINWFLRHPDYIDRVARRASPHLYYIVNEIEQRGLPAEFALLPIVESAYDPFAYSHGRAAGLWQFVPATARVYGLHIDWWYDGRRDVRTSTEAAITYLEYLHQMFDEDWLLALAAYNAGQGNVLKSIGRSKIPRDEVDFWSLKVLRETSTYVPRLLAISAVIAEPEKYNISLPDLPNKPYWEVVQTGGQLDLHKAAELAGVSTKTIYSLNAGYNQWATHPDGPHEIIVPVDKAASFRERLASLPPEERVAWRRHRIRPGESLGSIARDFSTTVSTLRTINSLPGNMIRAGDSLMIPVSQPGVEYHMSAEGRLARQQEGFTQKYGSEPIRYVVKAGDSFWEISKRFGVGMRELARWNGMGTTTTLYPGRELVIYQKQQVAVSQPVRSNEQVRKLNYRVRPGESLSLIAAKFNVSVQKILNWNNALQSRKYIHPGDELTLYVDVTRLVN